jgi:acyl carrier protein
MPEEAEVRQRIKHVMIDALGLETMTPDQIGNDELLWGDGLGLDSVDALELMVALEREYGFSIDNDQIDPEQLGTVSGIARFVLRHLQ